MLYTRRRDPLVYHLLPGYARKGDEHPAMFPSLLPGEDIVPMITVLDGPSPTVEPCSLDVLLRRFSRTDGTSLKFPFVVEPEGDIIGHSDLVYTPAEYYDMLCVETRSRQAARRGFTCRGFSANLLGRPTAISFLTQAGSLSFSFRNYLPVPIIISEPFSPVQISIIREVHEHEYRETIAPRFSIKKDGKNITSQSYVHFPDFDLPGYRVTCSDEVWYFDASSDPIDLREVDQLMKKTILAELPRLRPAFCLTITEEEIDTAHSPAYLFPFHYLDIEEDSFEMLKDRERLANFLSSAFSDPHYLPITSNAGLFNPGCTGRMVLENITRHKKEKDFKKYMTREEYTGLVIRIPFYQGRTSSIAYGGCRHQTGIDIAQVR